MPSGLSWVLRDSWTEATRHLRILPRHSELLVFSAVQPIMFVLLFFYVFGGSIFVPDYPDYVQYLLPGIFAQTVVFNSAFTGVGLAEDLGKGLVDRLRSLPMVHAAVLIGRTISDLARNVLSFAIMFAVALAVGFRLQGSLWEGLVATLVLLYFAYAFSWVQALVGLSVRSVESANSAGFIWMFPFTFISSAFVDTASMPYWIEPVAEANPFTKATNATRALYNGLDPGTDLWWALGWATAITGIFAVLAARRFESSARR